MESSQFTNCQQSFESLEPLEVQGATCNTFRVKLYGKLHFLKQLKPEFANDIRYQEAFRKEFETGYRLEHPCLVRYISLSDDGILMEYVDGETLTQRLANHPDFFYDRKNADKFLHQLLDVVGYLHSHQVLHLDLKPDNIMLTCINDDVKLVDLGCCYTDTFTDTTGRTDGFAAPEQYSIFRSTLPLSSSKNSQFSIQTDIYAIGRILEQLPCHHIYNKVIARCTAPDKANRYQSVQEVLHDVTHRHSPLRYILAAIAILIIVSSVFLLTHRSESDAIERTPQDTTLQSEIALEPSLEVIQQPSTPTSLQPSETLIEQEKTSQQEDDETLMKQELERLIDKVYKATILTFCDSVFPVEPDLQSCSVGEKWHLASTEFHSKTVQICDSLVRNYPHLPESSIHQMAENRFQTLVSYVFNKMRENGKKP